MHLNDVISAMHSKTNFLSRYKPIQKHHNILSQLKSCIKAFFTYSHIDIFQPILPAPLMRITQLVADSLFLNFLPYACLTSLMPFYQFQSLLDLRFLFSRQLTVYQLYPLSDRLFEFAHFCLVFHPK